LAHIEEVRRVNKTSQAGRVTLMTIHQAKGLEFRCVIVPGLNEGIRREVEEDGLGAKESAVFRSAYSFAFGRCSEWT